MESAALTLRGEIFAQGFISRPVKTKQNKKQKKDGITNSLDRDRVITEVSLAKNKTKKQKTGCPYHMETSSVRQQCFQHGSSEIAVGVAAILLALRCYPLQRC